MLRSYAPALVFVVLGMGVGGTFAMLNRFVGARRRDRDVQADPYECGLPSEYTRTGKFGVSFYLVAIMFIVFDLEVIFVYPAAVVLRDFGVHGLIAVGIFIGLLGIAFVYEWARGALDWR